MFEAGTHVAALNMFVEHLPAGCEELYAYVNVRDFNPPPRNYSIMMRIKWSAISQALMAIPALRLFYRDRPRQEPLGAAPLERRGP